MSRNRPPSNLIELAEAVTANGLRGRAMLAKHSGECGWCGQAIFADDLIVWLPADRAALCAGCAADGESP